MSSGMKVPFYVKLLFSISTTVLEYVDIVVDVVCIRTYYDAWSLENLSWTYPALQLLSMVLPAILMMFYWYRKTKEDTLLPRMIAIGGLGLLHDVVFPIAALLKSYPAMRGYETANKTAIEDDWRIKRLRIPQIIFENVVQVINFAHQILSRCNK